MPSSNVSLADKYESDRWAVQFAVDLIDYVRTVESAEPIVEPARGRADSISSTEVDYN